MRIDPNETRTALLGISSWIEDPVTTQKPSSQAIAQAVRLSARTLAQSAPGHSVELRVPPYVAVQCIEGPRHTRGTPPNVVEMDAITWLKLSTGKTSFNDALAAGKIFASGTRSAEIADWLPIVKI